MTEQRVLLVTKVNELCIENEYYKNGSNEEYMYLLDEIFKARFTFNIDDIEEFAFDIIMHTDKLDIVLDIEAVMSQLLNKCVISIVS